MKKVFDQTVRDLKREVNKKVLKVPGIEQKVLDATSNEPWGPHGSLLADIAQASRNYHEYQMIMTIIWKRISDTGKNWRHVYKALAVLEYMVAHGSERVVDEIRERAYQISTLSDFQYIDSSGRDQGNNVRKKSQSLVSLVNDKERIAEVRQKAAANRDKFRSSVPGGMYRPSGGYGDRYDYESRYGGKDEERSSYGREYGYRDDDRSSRDGDHYSRDYEDRYGRDGYRDDDYRGRSRSVDNYQYGSRSRSADRERAFEDDGQSSSRGSGARADDHSQDGRPLERKFSEQNIVAPPSYEDAVSESRSPVYSERDGGETPQVAAPGAASPAGNNANKGTDGVGDESSPPTQEVEAFDEFDPRGSVSASPLSSVSAPPDAASITASGPPTLGSTSGLPASNNVEMDLLGSLSDAFSPNPMAIVPVDPASVVTDGDVNSVPAPSFPATQPSTQPFDDPFGDSPFKAIPSADTNLSTQQGVAASFQPTPPTHNQEPMQQPIASKPDTADNFGFGDTLSAVTGPNPSVPDVQPPSDSPFSPQELSTQPQNEIDILAGILPPSGPSVPMPLQPGAPIPTSQIAPSGNVYESFHPQAISAAPNMPPQTPFGQSAQPYGIVSHPQNLMGGMPFNGGGSAISASSQTPQYTPGIAPQFTSGNLPPQPVSATSSSNQTPYYTAGGPATQPQLNGGNMTQMGPGVTSHVTQQAPSGPVAQHGNNFGSGLFTSAGPSSMGASSQPALSPSAGALDFVPQPPKKFEPKSAIWADTLSRGLVNFNISGPKANPLADIGVDFEAINRKEKRMEKPAATPVVSITSMGKAMGSGSGLGRTGANAMRPPPNPMVGPGMAMGGGGYGGMNQQMGMGMGMNMNMNMNMGMGMGQGYPMQPQTGMAPRPGMPGTYNPMMGPGGYNPQQPYGGGYR